MAHEIRRAWKDMLRSAVPFGLGQTKPQHFAEMPVIAWKKESPGSIYWTLDSVHLCMTRLQLLRLNYDAGA